MSANIIDFPNKGTIMGNLNQVISTVREGRVKAMACVVVFEDGGVGCFTMPEDHYFSLLGGIEWVKKRTLEMENN